MGRRLKYRSGKASVELSGEIRDAIERALEQVAPRTLAVLDDATSSVVEAARPQWPVKTGLSQKTLTNFVRVSRTSIEGVVENPAWKRGKRGKDYYAYMINRGATWKKLCENPTLDKVEDVAQAVAEEAAALLEG